MTEERSYLWSEMPWVEVNKIPCPVVHELSVFRARNGDEADTLRMALLKHERSACPTCTAAIIAWRMQQ